MKKKITTQENEEYLKDPQINKLIKSVVGEEGIDIISHLFSVSKADEFEIATKLGADVNFVRSIMYKMYTHNLVNYTRRRDPERGWYIYTWELMPKKLYFALINSHEKNLGKLYKKIEEEKNKEQGFFCPTCSIYLDFSKALSVSFSCFACGGMLQPLNNKKRVTELDGEINVLSQEIGLLKQRLNKF